MKLDDIELRDLSMTDCEALAQMLNNKHIWDNLRDYIPFPYKLHDAQSYVRRVSIEEQLTAFGIEYKGEFAGVISLKQQSDIHRISAEIGYWIGEPFWGKGITWKAIMLITQHGFKNLGLHKIFAIIMDYNLASKRVLQKVGYKQEGFFKGALIKNDKIFDEVRFGITKDEFVYSESPV